MTDTHIFGATRERTRLLKYEASLRLDDARNEVAQATTNLRSARAALHAARVAYSADEISLSDYADAQISVSEALAAHAKAEAKRIIAQAEVQMEEGILRFMTENGL